jgi:hypothetical protein
VSALWCTGARVKPQPEASWPRVNCPKCGRADIRINYRGALAPHYAAGPREDDRAARALRLLEACERLNVLASLRLERDADGLRVYGIGGPSGSFLRNAGADGLCADTLEALLLALAERS